MKKVSVAIFLAFASIYTHCVMGMIRINQDCDFNKAVCLNECECGYGYYICNGTWTYRDIPESTVCVQDGNDVYLHPINYEYGAKKCGDKLKQCGNCINGSKQCVDEHIPSSGYMECVNEKYIFRQAIDRLCKQVDATRINLIPLADIQSTYSNTIKDSFGVDRPCIQGDQRCLESCTCRSEYQICRDGKWYNFVLPTGHVCTQLKYGVEIVDIHDPDHYLDLCDNKLKYCDDELLYQHKCHEGNTKCGDQCKCGVTYSVCEGNQWEEYTPDPSAVCVQRTPSNTTLLPCDDNNVDIICPFNKQLTNTNKMNNYFDESTCIEGTEQCIDDIDILQGYNICNNNIWYYNPITSNQKCIQDGTKVIIKTIDTNLIVNKEDINIEYSNECEYTDNIDSDNIYMNNLYNNNNNNDENICISKDGTYCVEECKFNSGFNRCIDGVPHYQKLDDNQVCWQASPSGIKIIQIDGENSHSDCKGKIH